MKRRDWLCGVLAGAWLGRTLSSWCGGRLRPDFSKLVPPEKKLDPTWLASLGTHSEPLKVRWPQSRWIGMPIGGIGCGQLYLGGDGRLWYWGIFNEVTKTGAEHYLRPMAPFSPVHHGFSVVVRGPAGVQTRRLSGDDWAEVEFLGEYPIGRVTYRDPNCPIEVRLEAWSPFVPLDEASSTLPVTVLRYELDNPRAEPVEVHLVGWLQNPVALHSGLGPGQRRVNRVVREAWGVGIECFADGGPEVTIDTRPDIVWEDFERDRYEPWTVEGTAFGTGPVRASDVPAYQGDLRMSGERAVNSHASAPGQSVAEKDRAVGTLTSPPFRIERRYIQLLVGGGAHEGATCVELLVEGQVVRSVAGRNQNAMEPLWIDVRDWEGRQAQLRIADRATGSWGHIGVDRIVFTDRGPTSPPLRERPDFGDILLAVIGGGDARAHVSSDAGPLAWMATDACPQASGTSLTGAVWQSHRMPAGGRASTSFVLAWYFPNLTYVREFRALQTSKRRAYAARFTGARSVAEHLVARHDELWSATRRWRDTWYDSTLPRWLLDRIGANIATLATNTCYLFDDGRFYGWEGVGCCPGTCAHVWHYAQAVAWLFPTFERRLRTHVDFGLAMDDSTGAIRFRGEFKRGPAVDAQAGVVLRTLREHRLCSDDSWLRSVWPRARKALEFLISMDGNGDGLIEGAQHNTLDADWYGPVAWLSGMYLAALRAGAVMAREVGDLDFARTCETIATAGAEQFARRLFNGEYFINLPDPAHPEAINSGSGCHIDQVLGQWWAWQIGLGRLWDEAATRSALRALWKYNFTTDVGAYREVYRPGRWYAAAGEAGLLMCTFPLDDWDYDRAKGRGPDWAAGYFNECMTGFEYAAASHMIWEGLVTEGLAVARAVHDRYSPLRRNPYNEVECGDHYARAMSSYGLLLALSGYEHHGPRGELAFAPRLRPENFRAPFTAAGGWGTYWQTVQGSQFHAGLHVRHGLVRIRTLRLSPPFRGSVRAWIGGKPTAVSFGWEADGRLRMEWPEPLDLSASELRVEVTSQ